VIVCIVDIGGIVEPHFSDHKCSSTINSNKTEWTKAWMMQNTMKD